MPYLLILSVSSWILSPPPPPPPPSLWDDPGGAVAKEELLALGLSPDYRHECGICGICDRDYMLRRGGARAVGTRRGDRRA